MAKGKIKVHSLTGRITSKLMFEAWRAVRRNRGAAGIDKVSIRMFEQNLDANLDRLMREVNILRQSRRLWHKPRGRELPCGFDSISFVRSSCSHETLFPDSPPVSTDTSRFCMWQAENRNAGLAEPFVSDHAHEGVGFWAAVNILRQSRRLWSKPRGHELPIVFVNIHAVRSSHSQKKLLRDSVAVSTDTTRFVSGRTGTATLCRPSPLPLTTPMRAWVSAMD